MTVLIVVVTAACSAVGSFVTGYSLSAVQYRRAIKYAGKSEVATQERLAKFEAVREINGIFRNLSHDITHARDRYDEYFHNAAMRKISRIREFARSECYILGENYVAVAHRATDIAGLLMEILALHEKGFKERGFTNDSERRKELRNEPVLIDRFRRIRDSSGFGGYRMSSDTDYLHFRYIDSLDELNQLADRANPQLER